jgi:8-oxo-dGTP pyrophosphatase MutT (NUDIX family)
LTVPEAGKGANVALEPLPAATVTLVRDSGAGPEVLMLQRNFQSGFMPGMYMFPGGALDPLDYSEQACALCTGLDDATASRVLKLERNGLAYWVAAIRESFEEAGILLACNARGEIVALDEPVTTGRFRDHRHALNAGDEEFTKLVIKEQLRLAVDQLVYFSHWITPLGAPRRYDTRFFVARAPEAQEPLHDNVEAIAHTWMRPQAALAAHARGEFDMRTPTRKTLESFAAFESVRALIQAMRALNEIPAMLPRITADGRRLLPGEAGYEDAETTERPGRWET